MLARLRTKQPNDSFAPKNEEQFAIIADSINHLPDGIARFDGNEKLVYCNTAYLNMNAVIADLCVPGVSFESLARGKVERDWMGGPEDDKEEYIAERVRVFRGGRREWEEEYKDGTWILARDQPTDDGGRVCLRLDITERKKSEKVQDKTLSELRAVMESIDYGIIFMDADLRVIIANKAYRDMWQHSKDLLDGSPMMADLMTEHRHNDMYSVEDGKFDVFVKRQVKAVRNGSISPREITRPDGRVFIYQCVALPANERMLTFYEITKQKEAEERIRHLANHDPLTELPSLRLAREILSNAITLSRRYKWQFSVMYVDLDGFKAVNDTHGHSFGDDLLKKIALRLKNCLRESDTVARIGGDEFLVIQNELRSRDDAARVAENIIEKLSKPFELQSHTITIGASIGIAVYPIHGTTATDIIKTADKTMYAVKKTGKNSYQFAEG